MELVGGDGYTEEYPVARRFRDAQVLTVWEGPELEALITALKDALHDLMQNPSAWQTYWLTR